MSRTQPRGQTLAEFALVLPILLFVVLLAVVDFGRVFSANIAIEAAARNGAGGRRRPRATSHQTTRSARQSHGVRCLLHRASMRKLPRWSVRSSASFPNTTFDPTEPDLSGDDRCRWHADSRDARGAGMRAGRH